MVRLIKIQMNKEFILLDDEKKIRYNFDLMFNDNGEVNIVSLDCDELKRLSGLCNEVVAELRDKETDDRITDVHRHIESVLEDL